MPPPTTQPALHQDAPNLGAFIDDKTGVVTIELAILATVLSFLAIGVLDFSLAYVRQSEMSNAVRAGTQLALVRRPSLGPSATDQESIVSLATIREAVVNSANFLTEDPGEEVLTTGVFCQCPDGLSIPCTDETGTSPSCTGKQAFLEITLVDQYQPIFSYPALPENIRLVAQQSIRLN